MDLLMKGARFLNAFCYSIDSAFYITGNICSILELISSIGVLLKVGRLVISKDPKLFEYSALFLGDYNRVKRRPDSISSPAI
jgi:hypothetical protein